MRIGIDADGVLYPFEDGLRTYLVDFVGMDPQQLCSITRWHFYEEWGLSREQFKEYYTDAINVGVLFANPGPYEGTREGLLRLIEAGHTLHVVTARGDTGHPGQAEGMTRFWLAMHLPPISSLTFSADKTVVKADVFLEDKIENYDALDAAGVRAYLMNRPWNEQVDERRRVADMGEFVDEVLSLNVWAGRQWA